MEKTPGAAPLLWSAVDRCLLWLGLVLVFCGFYLYRLDYLLTHPMVESYYDRGALRVVRDGFVVITSLSVLLFGIGLVVRRRPGERRWLGHAANQVWWVSTATAAYALGPVTSPILGLLLLGGVVSAMLFSRRVVVPAMAVGMAILIVTTVAERAGLVPYAPLFKAPPTIDGRLSTEYVVATSVMAYGIIVLSFVLSTYVVERGRARERVLLATNQEREQARIELARARDELEARIAERTAELSRFNQRLVEEAAERKRAQAALAESEKRLREQLTELELLYQNAPIGLCFQDADLRYVRINERLAAINGKPVAEHIGRTMWETIPEIAAIVGPTMRRVLETGEPVLNHQVLGSTPAEPDTERCWLTSYFPVRSADGEILGISAVVQDISELRWAEERARRHLDTLAHVSRLTTMGQMATGIAHELNQPLAAITNYAFAGRKKLQDGTVDAAELAATLEELVTQALRAGEIVHHLRGFVRKQKADADRVPASINALIGDVLTLLGSELRLAAVEATLELADAIPAVRVDAIQIQQVILNLLRNALEAMADVEPTRRRLAIATTARPGKVEVVVRDSGTGLPADNTDCVFDPFYTTKREGMGMGLAISRSIIEEHGGRLWAEVDADGSSVFRFTLPVLDGDDCT